MSAPAPSTAPAVPSGTSGATETSFDNVGVPAIPIATDQTGQAPSNTDVEPHTGRVNNIDQEIYTHYVAMASLNWTTSMLVGTLVWSIPIHPRFMNSWIVHLSQMYNAWAGDFDFQFKIAGTGFHAGQLNFVRLPPNIKPETVENYQQYTCFEWTGQDPKILAPFSMNVMDQRPVLYHYTNEFDINRPDTFGGFFCIYVNQPLSTSATGSTNINVMMWNRPGANFIFSQLKPPSTALSNTTPFTEYEKLFTPDFNTPMTTDWLKVVNIVGFAADASILTGRYGCRDINGVLLKDNYVEWKNQIISGHSANPAASMHMTSIGTSNIAVATAPNISRGRFISGTRIGTGLWCIFAPSSVNPEFVSTTNWLGTTFDSFSFGVENVWPKVLNQVFLLTNTSTTWTNETDDIAPFIPFGGECILWFQSTVNSNGRYATTDVPGPKCMQTLEQSLLLAALPPANIPSGQVLLFNIVDRLSNLPIFQAKLYQEGYFTINPRSTNLSIPFASVKLVYVSLINRSDPLVPVPSMVTNQMILQAANKQLRVTDMIVKDVRRRRDLHLSQQS